MIKIRNSKGVTLVELLAVLVLISLVFLLIISTQLFGQREYETQTKRMSNKESVQFLFKDITREIRKIDDNSKIQTGSDKKILIIGDKFYTFQSHTVRKNDNIIVENIDKFSVKFNPSRDTLQVNIITQGSPRNVEKLETSIYLREGN